MLPNATVQRHAASLHPPNYPMQPGNQRMMQKPSMLKENISKGLAMSLRRIPKDLFLHREKLVCRKTTLLQFVGFLFSSL